MSAGRIPYYELHAFSEGPFTGNPAGVCLLEAFPEDAVLRGIAASNNLSETAFLVRKPDETDAWSLRWFTPAVEVDLCGHATFAPGALLFELGMVAGGAAHFDTRSGRLMVRAASGGRYEMDLPEVGFAPAPAHPAAVAALGAGAPVEAYDVKRVHGAGYQMLVFSGEAVIAGLKPDHGALRSANVNVIATAPGDSADFVSRFFAPASGVDEDPVTGSAHCTLAPYWAKRLGRARLSARQIGPRPGALEVETRSGRVLLSGRAARWVDGVILLPD